MMPGIDDLPPLRDVINQFELRAKKNLGQNFLLDLNLTTKIARQAGDLRDCDVLEIGPGPGGLTRALLLEGARKLVVVERDARCIPALQQIAKHCPDQLTILEGDALSVDPRPFLTQPVRVVANLPYNLGTELLIRWLTPAEWPPYWSSLTLMFQKEVAQRIVAVPGTKAYGRLSVLAQWRCNAKMVMEIPPQAFTPAPKVSSAVVHLERLAAPRFAADETTLVKVVAAAFGQRRKMLRSSLKKLSPEIENILQRVGIDPTSRAEQTSIEKFCALACVLKKD